MRDFEIFTDSCSDLPKEYIKEKNIKFARLTCTYDDKTYFDDFGESLSYKKFFDDLRNGTIAKTSQPSVDEFYSNFKKIIDSGKDVLYICVSTGLSGSENSATIAKNMILEEYTEVNIYIVNVLTASLGQGIMVMKAVEMKEEGKSLEEIVEYIEKNKQRLNTFMTVDDLNHLKRGGRLSTAAAMIGTVFSIKPILSIDADGRVISIDKARGRKASLKKLVDLLLERIEEAEKQIIGISHGDCIDEVLKLKDAILSKINVKDVIINYTGPAVGTHGGPGNVAIFFMGKERKIL
ncbi:DegV family protein [Clostridium cochlearium]|uniref:DegV family protein n=1 Tax=Clostridium cochlearium TaxID=1494 RepID=A0A2X2VS68_CLOCO|nr:DegV family protein [Clostridium cochlearium]MBE6064589.1 DegV family protein [Clostridium cochlearium]MBU5268459.1 DegV family protein [Clostridium cochlearium]NMA57563.1 DegV family protein [Clostridium cochlearium]NOH15701.1 DegV family protein [Clostridium cochlearium]SQB33882.1 degV protein [Clostridium cochlearium]